MTENWIRTNAAEDVAGSIRHTIRTVQFVGEDPLAWKWVTLALHSALQGACVCHVTTTAAPLGAVTKRNAAEWSAYFDGRSSNPTMELPKTQLMALPELLKAARKPYSAGNGSGGVEISHSELNWLRRYHEDVRNQFVHFEPTSWSIEVSGIPEIAKLVSRIIGEILQIGWAFRQLDNVQKEEMKSELQALGTIEWPTMPVSKSDSS